MAPGMKIDLRLPAHIIFLVIELTKDNATLQSWCKATAGDPDLQATGFFVILPGYLDARSLSRDPHAPFSGAAWLRSSLSGLLKFTVSWWTKHWAWRRRWRNSSALNFFSWPRSTNTAWINVN